MRDPDLLDLVQLEALELLSELGYDDEAAPVVTGSALCALEGREPELGAEVVLKLLEALDSYVPLPHRELEKLFLLPIESIHSIPGIEVFHRTLACAEAGDHLRSLVRGLKRGEVRRGMLLCRPGSIKPHKTVQEQEMIMPGEDALVTISLCQAMVLEKGQRFTLRECGKMIGAGLVTEILTAEDEG